MDRRAHSRTRPNCHHPNYSVRFFVSHTHSLRLRSIREAFGDAEVRVARVGAHVGHNQLS